MGRNALQAAATTDLDLVWEHDFKLTKDPGDDGQAIITGVSAF